MPQPSLEQRVYYRRHVILAYILSIHPSSAHFQSLKCSKGTWIFSLSSFLPKFLGFLLYSPLVLANALLNVVPLPMYCLVCSNVSQLIFRGKVKLLMCSIDSIPCRHQYLHIFSCPGALSSAFASYSSGSPDQAAGIRKCWKNPLSMQSALGILGPSPAASCQPDAKRARFEPIYWGACRHKCLYINIVTSISTRTIVSDTVTHNDCEISKSY